MEHGLRAVWIALVLTVYGVASQPGDVSSDAEIEYAAAHMKLDVVMQTMHDIGGKFKIVFVLTNIGTQNMLPKSDWNIIFHYQNRLTTPQTSADSELELAAAENCLYVILPKKGSAYDGFQPYESKAIEVEAAGISLYKSEFFPNFAIYSTTTGKTMNINSTSDNSLAFVHLADANKTEDDPSIMNGLQRMMTFPDVPDVRKVPDSFVIPTPLMVLSDRARVMRLGDQSVVNIVHDPESSMTFRNELNEFFITMPNMSAMQVVEKQNPVPGQHNVVVKLVRPNTPEYLANLRLQEMTDEGYNLTILPNRFAKFDVTLLAKSQKGLFNAFRSLQSVFGVFSSAPTIIMEDDRSFPVRSVELDLTKNFFPLSFLTKFVDVMSMMKLNELVVNLADDNAWRLEVDDAAADFKELHTFGSQRCVNLNKCLPPLFGAGADGTASSSGYLNASEFQTLLIHADQRHISVIPKINYLGGMNAAIEASVRRFERLKATDMNKADELYLLAAGPPNAPPPPPGTCKTNTVLNPCIPQTERFIEVINGYITQLYKNVSVDLKAIHAGGDDGVNLFQHFTDCMAMNVPTTVLKRDMVTMVQRYNPGVTIVNEEAVIGPNNIECISPLSAGTGRNIDLGKLRVAFHKDFLLDPASMGFTKQEEDFLLAPVEQPPEDGNETAQAAFVPDYKKTYTGTRRGIKAPWSKAYRCANAGFKVLLKPHSFLNLDAGYELSWEEVATHKPNSYSTINRHRILFLEPGNVDINIDRATDMSPVLPHRLLQIVDSEQLTKEGERNLLGVQGSIDTTAIRTEQTFWETTVSRLVALAEKAWHRPLFENTVKPSNLSTYDDPTLTVRRAQSLMVESMNFFNAYGYKERGRLDKMGVPCRVGKIAAGIANALVGPVPTGPPFPVQAKTDLPGSQIQFRDNHDRQWRLLYWEDPTTGFQQGGYTFAWPPGNQTLEMRLVSVDGSRASKTTIVRPEPRNLVPPIIPLGLRQDTCLDVKSPELDLDTISLQQWVKILNNLRPYQMDMMQFGQRRSQLLLQHLMHFNAQNNITLPANVNIQQALGEVQSFTQHLLQIGQPLYSAYKYIFDQDKAILERRQQELKAKYNNWHNMYLRQCAKTP